MAAEHKRAQEADGEKAGVDHYFEIPLNAAKEVIGFKHDEDIPGVDYEGFEVLRKGPSSADSQTGGIKRFGNDAQPALRDAPTADFAACFRALKLNVLRH
ncbi:MAG: hypothetical protein U1E75_00660 [Alicycliphilus sp.]